MNTKTEVMNLGLFGELIFWRVIAFVSLRGRCAANPVHALQLWQDNRLLLLILPFFIRIGDFTFFICFKEQDLG
jgi:hypothetical protein